MYQFTTPTITVSIPDTVPVDTIDKLVVTIQQNSIKLEKTQDNVVLDTATNSVLIHLTQEETGAFPTGTVSVQLHILVGQTAYATNIMKANIYPNIHGEVIV